MVAWGVRVPAASPSATLWLRGRQWADSLEALRSVSCPGSPRPVGGLPHPRVQGTHRPRCPSSWLHRCLVPQIMHSQRGMASSNKPTLPLHTLTKWNASSISTKKSLIAPTPASVFCRPLFEFARTYLAAEMLSHRTTVVRFG